MKLKLQDETIRLRKPTQPKAVRVRVVIEVDVPVEVKAPEINEVRFR